VARSALAAALCLGLSACGGGVDDGKEEAASSALATLSGTVVYRERMALPINAVITVRLQDVSLQDVPAVLLAEETLSAQGRSVPIPWSLDYDPNRIQERLSYAVRAEIRSPEGELLWTTDTVHPVLTRGAPSDDVEILVRRVAD
jgi:putative lipoprotein